MVLGMFYSVNIRSWKPSLILWAKFTDAILVVREESVSRFCTGLREEGWKARRKRSC